MGYPQMLKIENLSQCYGLTDVNCTFSQGKLIGVMGANGAGKSTLLKTIAGILPPTSGEIWFNNCKLTKLSYQQRSQKLAYLSQYTDIHWNISVYDTIALGLACPLPYPKEKEKVHAISAQFSVTHLLTKLFNQLSGGEKARVQLARCCIKEAPLLLVDEPIAPLDPFYQIDIMEQLKQLTPHQTCVVAIHHLPLAYQFCDEILLLKNGSLLASGETRKVLTAENLAQAFQLNVEFDKTHSRILSFDKLNARIFTE